MNRRGFFKGALGLAAAPFVSALPAIAIHKGTAVGASTLFVGEIGRWNGVKIHEGLPFGIVRNMKPEQDELNRLYAGLQWEPDQFDALRALEPRPLVINHVRPAVDAFIAQQRDRGLRWA